MSEKIRGALFNSLGDIKGLTVLDAFAGSGAIAFEAISRGAARATAVESDKPAQRAIRENIDVLNLDEKVTLINSFIVSFVRRTHEVFDIVVADPPFDDLQYKSLEVLPKVVRPGGILIYNLPPHGRLILPKEFELIQQKSYGDAKLHFYRHAV
jgi:16S rRNA (guanine966-N2)-methyltransferase